MSITPGLFTIETAIHLHDFTVEPNVVGDSGVLLTWRTDPGPEALAGFKLEKRKYGEEFWRVLIALTRESQHLKTLKLHLG